MPTPYAEDTVVDACACFAHSALSIYRGLDGTQIPSWLSLSTEQRERVRSRVQDVLDGSPLDTGARGAPKLEQGLFVMAVTAMYATCHQTELVAEVVEIAVEVDMAARQLDLPFEPKTEPANCTPTDPAPPLDEAELPEAERASTDAELDARIANASANVTFYRSTFDDDSEHEIEAEDEP